MNIRGLMSKLASNERMGSGPLYVRVLRPFKQSDGAWLADEYRLDGEMCGWKDGHVSILAEMPDRPEIVCLCGSTRFKEEFEAEERRLGLEGRIVLTVSMFGHSGDLRPEECQDGHPTKTALDGLHFRKIEMADRVHVVNVGGYIGESTRREIDHARALKRRVTYLEPTDASAHTEKGSNDG